LLFLLQCPAVSEELSNYTRGLPMFLRNMIFYSIVGGVLWAIAEKLGVDFGLNMAISLLVPPLIPIIYTLYKNRGPLL
jgi:hypothetical protein